MNAHTSAVINLWLLGRQRAAESPLRARLLELVSDLNGCPCAKNSFTNLSGSLVFWFCC